jgi:hypothetical protein
MITVCETIKLNEEHANPSGALLAGQTYDELLHDNAHHADGYVDHAAFLYEFPDRLIVLYPWRDEPSARELVATEESILEPFVKSFCAEPRGISFLAELRVEV